jgi:hypothetical protein
MQKAGPPAQVRLSHHSGQSVTGKKRQKINTCVTNAVPLSPTLTGVR